MFTPKLNTYKIYFKLRYSIFALKQNEINSISKNFFRPIFKKMAILFSPKLVNPYKIFNFNITLSY